MKLSQAIQEFRDWRGFRVTGHTVVRYDSVLKIFCLCLGDPDIEAIQLQHVMRHMSEMQRLGWKRNGLNIVALALRKFFEFFNMRGYQCMDENLIPLPRKEFNIPRVASDTDYKKLTSAIPKDTDPHNQRNLALISMVWDTWARIGEVLSLDEQDLKFNRNGSGSATIKTEKSRGRRPIREIFWKPSTVRHLKKWLEKKHHLQEKFHFSDPNAVFVTISKCESYDTRGNRMTGKNANEVFRRISNTAGLKANVNPHSMRHHGGREIIKKGGSNSDVSNILGHSNIESSAIYTMMYGDDLRERWQEFHKPKAKQKPRHHIFHGSLKNPQWGIRR